MLADSLAKVSTSLPPLAPEDEADQQSRAIFGLVVARALSAPCPLATFEPDVTVCPNCGQPVDSDRSPYCGDACKEEAAFVRQLRAGLLNGAALDPERQVMMGQALWYLLGGGYPRRITLVPDKARTQVIVREGGICEGCGGVATTIDHARTACNRPINLRAVCANCCRAKDYGDVAWTQSPAFQDRLAALAVRIGSEEPLRVCDDADNWDWRSYVKARKASR